MRESSETTVVLEKIRAVFAAARPEGVGRINNGLLAGVLGELIDRREFADAGGGGLVWIRPLGEGHSHVDVSMARFRAAFAEVHDALNDELDMTPERRALGDLLAGSVMETIEHLMVSLAGRTHSATESGDLPGRGDMARRDRSGG